MTLEVEAGSSEARAKVDAAVEIPPAAPLGTGGRKLDDVIINVRFNPDSSVNAIDHRPQHLGPQDWYHRLCFAAALNYRALAGGRGHFRIRRSDFEAILSEVVI